MSFLLLFVFSSGSLREIFVCIVLHFFKGFFFYFLFKDLNGRHEVIFLVHFLLLHLCQDFQASRISSFWWFRIVLYVVESILALCLPIYQ